MAKDSPTDRAKIALQNFFKSQGTDIKVYVSDRQDPDVKITIEPGGWDSIGANLGDFYWADDLAKRTQKTGYLLGLMSQTPTKPKSIKVEFNSISAPTGDLLEQFVTKWTAEHSTSIAR